MNPPSSLPASQVSFVRGLPVGLVQLQHDKFLEAQPGSRCVAMLVALTVEPKTQVTVSVEGLTNH
jgi:hypothetical protein